MITPAQIKQGILLLLILCAVVLVATQLYPFLPGLLGAVTLYILLREWFFRITVVHNWRPWLAATVFIGGSIVVFVLPFVITALLLAPKIEALLTNPSLVTDFYSKITSRLHDFIPQLAPGSEEIHSFVQRASRKLPSFLGSTLQVLANLLLCFFLLYFMLISGRRMERKLQEFMSLKDENIDEIWVSTRIMVVSSAIGIPVLAIIQAIAATVGYMIFHVEGALLWGVLTGIFSMLPVIGSGMVFVPMVAYLYATGNSGQATGLLIYSLVVIANIDNVMRFTLLRKLGNVHPVITVLGVIVGVPLFGFMGLIFGPLLLSYMLLLIRIYRVEFPGRPGQRTDGGKTI
jgi:predicted PurR-regulated permease PerM